MEKIRLSKRLLEAAQYTRRNESIADIGSDHAYLPIYLVQQAIVPSAIAGEVVKGPYERAKQTVKNHRLTHAIDVRLGNGLEVLLEDEALGTIFICGMGGKLIADILKDGVLNQYLPKNARLVLQPNNNESTLRRYLSEQSYAITAESILEENGKIYEMIVVDYTKEKPHYSDTELLFGPKLIQSPSKVFQKKWQQELEKSQRILKDLVQSTDNHKINDFKKYIHQIKRVIS